ncbi:MAG TPA: helix-turn-helix domain-containing protein [Catenuloplanes sp.]
MPRTLDPDRRGAILDAAHAVFARKGYAATGIADVAGELGIGHGTVYRYFANKREVAAAVLERAVARVADVVAAERPDVTASLPAYRAQVERIGERLFALFIEDPALGRLLYDLPAADEELRQRLGRAFDLFADYTAAYLHNGVTQGFLRDDLDVAVTARIVNAMIFEGAAQVSQAADPRALGQRWIGAVITLMFAGIAPR